MVEVSRQLKVLVERIQTAVRQAEDAVEVSNTVQELYQSLYRHLNSFQTFKGERISRCTAVELSSSALNVHYDRGALSDCG